MKNELITLADHLDRKGMHKEADYIDTLVKKAVGGPLPEWFEAVQSELVQMNFKYSLMGAAQIMWDHSDTLYNIYMSKGPLPTAKRFMDLYLAM